MAIAARQNFNVQATRLPASTISHSLLSSAAVEKRVVSAAGKWAGSLNRTAVVDRALNENDSWLNRGQLLPTLSTVQYSPNAEVGEVAHRVWHPDMKLTLLDGRQTTLGELVPFAMPMWHFLTGGTDMFSGVPTISRPWDNMLDPYARSMVAMRALLEFNGKMGIPYYCAHNGDLIDLTQTNLRDIQEQHDLMVQGVMKPLQEQTGVGLGWYTNQFFVAPLFSEGAFTGPHTDAYLLASWLAKSALDTVVDLGGRGFVWWGGREGFKDARITDMPLQGRLASQFFRNAVNYGEKIGFFQEGRKFWIEPKRKEPSGEQADADVRTSWSNIQEAGLQDHIGFNIEVNHAWLAGREARDEFMKAVALGRLYGIDANRGTNKFTGWDSDLFPGWQEGLEIGEALVHAGGTVKVVNFDAKLQREDRWEEYPRIVARGMDNVARGAYLTTKSGVPALQTTRWSEWRQPLGLELLSEGRTLESDALLAETHFKQGIPSGKQNGMQHLVDETESAGVFKDADAAIAARFAAQTSAGVNEPMESTGV